jgi:outer membrane lipoprotein carrier protein
MFKKINLLAMIVLCLAGIFVSATATAASAVTSAKAASAVTAANATSARVRGLSPATQLKKLLNSYSSYEASFKQTTYTLKGRVVARNSGRIALQHPRKFRWHTIYPTEQIIIANGKVLWVYDVDLQQATKRKFTADNSKIADLLSGGGDKIIYNYQVKLVKITKSTKSFKLYPLKKHRQQALFRSVEMKFQSSHLQSLIIDNNLDEQTEIIFSGVKLNRHLPASLFNFKAPHGVDVLTDK